MDLAMVGQISKNFGTSTRWPLCCGENLIEMAKSLSPSKITFKEETSMNELNKASEKFSEPKDVRIVYLPPSTVAASHYVGENPEENAEGPLRDFIKQSRLFQLKPDARIFGFNHPSPRDDSGSYGYEFWVTIPEDMDVPPPLTKKRYGGGLYAAHAITMGNFHEWDWLCGWVRSNPDYEPANVDDGGETMGGLLEEALSFLYNTTLEKTVGERQLDLLFPIKGKGKN